MNESGETRGIGERDGERIVTIFGGAKCSEADPEYVQARCVGGLLADAGFTICTGGYLGVMEAASRGAHERGGRGLGIVMKQFKAEPNRYLLRLLGQTEDDWPNQVMEKCAKVCQA